MIAVIPFVLPVAWAWLMLARVIHAPALRAGVALAMGIALPFLTTMAILGVRGRVDRQFILIDGAFWIGALAFAWWRRPRHQQLASVSPLTAHDSPVHVRWALWIALALCALALVRSSTALHGAWDAWAIWNLRARFLFLARDWTQAFTPDLAWSHPDYPLLLPLTVTRLWAWHGVETPWIPFFLGAAFAVATVLVVIGTTAVLNPPAWPIAGLLLIGSPWVREIPAQLADLPASLFFATAFGVGAVGWHTKSPAIVGLAGVAASMAAWTKNEGLLFALVASAVWTLRPKYLLPWMAGALPGLASLAWFKLTLAPASDLAQPVAQIVGNLVNPVRHAAVVQALPAAAGWSWAPAVAVLACLIVATRKIEATRFGMAVVLLMLAGYYFVYVTTPHPQAWHVETSFARLLAQVWPTAVLAVTAAGSDRGRGSGTEIQGPAGVEEMQA